MYDPVTSVEQVKNICKESSVDENSHITILSLKDTGEIVGTSTFGTTNSKDQWGLVIQ